MDALNTILKNEAISLGLCQQWQSQWDGSRNVAELAEMYKRGLDFCIKHNFPSNDFFCENFSENELYEQLIFVNSEIRVGFDVEAPSGTYVINGNCSGDLRFSGWGVATIYVRHESSVKIIASDFAKVFVRVYDDAQVEVEETDGAVVKVREKR